MRYSQELITTLQRVGFIPKPLMERLEEKFQRQIRRMWMIELEPGKPFYLVQAPQDWEEVTDRYGHCHLYRQNIPEALRPQIKFALTSWNEETYSYAHPYIPGIETGYWSDLVCSECNHLQDDCICEEDCEVCGEPESRCHCWECRECGDKIAQGESCNCMDPYDEEDPGEI